MPRLGEMQPPACAAGGFGAEFVPEVTESVKALAVANQVSRYKKNVLVVNVFAFILK